MKPLPLPKLRLAYRHCVECSHKQLGVRALKEAERMQKVNPERFAECYNRAMFYLPYAQAETERRKSK